MGYGEEFIRVAGIGAAIGDKGHCPAALCGGVVDSHKAGGDTFILVIPGNALVLDHVDHLHDQAVLAFKAVMDGGGFTARELLHHFKHRPADAGGINPNVGDVVAGHVILDAANLVFKVKAVPGFDVQDAEGLPFNPWRGHQDK